MMHRIQTVFRTVVGTVLALAILGISATFGLAILGIVSAMLLVCLAAAVITQRGATHQQHLVAADFHTSANVA